MKPHAHAYKCTDEATLRLKLRLVYRSAKKHVYVCMDQSRIHFALSRDFVHSELLSWTMAKRAAKRLRTNQHMANL